MGRKIKLLLAHHRQIEVADLDDILIAVRDVAVRELSPPGSETTVEVCTARDDFLARADALGGWNDWISDVVSGKDYATGGDRFDAIIVVPIIQPDSVGKATAQMVTLALQRRKPVMLWSVRGGFLPIVDVVVVDSKNFQSGWRVVPAQTEEAA